MNKLIRKIKEISEYVGSPIVHRDCKPYAYDGQTIALFDKKPDKIRPPSNLVHDIAHYLVASDERRRMPEFGLGESPDTMSYRYLSSYIDLEKANLEEEMASMLGILIEKEIGSDWKETWHFHNWSEGRLKDIDEDCFKMPHPKRVIKKLIKRKLIYKSLKPRSLSNV